MDHMYNEPRLSDPSYSPQSIELCFFFFFNECDTVVLNRNDPEPARGTAAPYPTRCDSLEDRKR